MADEIMNAPETEETTNNCPVCNKPVEECTCSCCEPKPPCSCCEPKPPCKPCPELPRRGTPFYHLPQWGPSDLCDWFVKMNISMMTIDSALHNMDLKIMRQPGELECRIKQLRADLQNLSDIVTCQGSSLIELKDRMDTVETSTNALQETINNQQLQISNLDTRVTTSELNVAAMQTRVANLDASFSKVTSEFALLKQDFAKLNLTVKEIQDAQTSIDEELDTFASDLQQEIQRSTAKDEEHDTEIAALKQVDNELITKDRELEAKNLEQDGKIQNNSSRIDTLSNDLKSTQDNIVIVKSDIVDLQREDTGIKKRLDDAERNIEDLQHNDGVLEQSIVQNTNNITTLTSTVENLVETEEGHDTRLTALETTTEQLNVNLTSVENRIEAVEDSNMTLGGKVGTLEQNVETITDTITAINDTVGSHTDKIGELRSDVEEIEETNIITNALLKDEISSNTFSGTTHTTLELSSMTTTFAKGLQVVGIKRYEKEIGNHTYRKDIIRLTLSGEDNSYFSGMMQYMPGTKVVIESNATSNQYRVQGGLRGFYQIIKTINCTTDLNITKVGISVYIPYFTTASGVTSDFTITVYTKN